MANLHLPHILFLSGTALLVASMFAYWVLYKTENESSQTYRKGQVFLGLSVLILHGILVRGVRPMAGFALVCLSVGTVAEMFGVKKGWIFGRYRYLERMGPKLFGPLPAVIPLLWLEVCYLGGSLAELLSRGMHLHATVIPWVRIAVASGIVTLFDAVIDPIAVSEGRWIWEKPGRYHGIPAGNFIGWFFTAAVIFTLLNSFFYRIPVRHGISGWLLFLPAFGHCLFLALCAKVCMERNLKSAGVIGWVAAAVFFTAGILALRG
jgi:uncharacterized membrane protein